MVKSKNSKLHHRTDFHLFKILPSSITIVSLFLGLTSIKAVIDGNAALSVNLILLAAVFDLLDGRIARILNATSKFGSELDSLCDFATFGIAPAFIVYYSALNNIYPLGWVAVCFFVAANILRLARFNSMANENNIKAKNYTYFFMGVPVPAGALLAMLPFCLEIRYDLHIEEHIIAIYLFIVSALMVSNIPTFSTKNLHFNKRLLPLTTALLFLFAMLLIYYTYTTLIVCGILYLLSLPITTYLFFKFKKKNQSKISH